MAPYPHHSDELTSLPDLLGRDATAILERITDGVFALDRQGRFIYVNRAAEEILQRDRSHLLGRSVWSIFPEATETRVFRRYQKAMQEQEVVHFEEVLPTLDRCFDVRLFPSEEGVSVYFRDVTERRRSEEALRKSEERFRLMVEGSEQVFFYEHDPEGHFTYLSPSVHRVLGYAPEELVGKSYESLLCKEQIHEHVRELTRAVVTEGVRPLPYIGCISHRTGRDVLLELTEGPLEREGHVVGVQGFARDVTHRQSLEEEREHLLAREREARHVAEREAQRREEVIAIVSHDLKSPLHAIALTADVLLEMPLTAEERTRDIRDILTATGQMERLIGGLLDISRVEAGQGLPVEPQSINTRSLVREACALFQAQAEAKQVRLLCDVGEEVPHIRADRERILQVFWNLIGNAVKFTPAGGSITVRAVSEGEHVLFSVSDSGPGIPEDDLPRLFSPYWQEKRTARLGTGLGLPITRAIVAAHGGRIWVDSQEGKGSTFSFTVPSQP